MDGYISYLSAAILWGIPCIETVIGKKITENDAEEITVLDYRARNKVWLFADGKKVHSCKLDLPDNAVIFRNGKMIASPELLFEQCNSPPPLYVFSALQAEKRLVGVTD